MLSIIYTSSLNPRIVQYSKLNDIIAATVEVWSMFMLSPGGPTCYPMSWSWWYGQTIGCLCPFLQPRSCMYDHRGQQQPSSVGQQLNQQLDATNRDPLTWDLSSMIEIQTWLVEHPKAGRKCDRSKIVPTVTMGGETSLPNSKGKTKHASMIPKFDSCSNRVLAVHLCNISMVSDFNRNLPWSIPFINCQLANVIRSTVLGSISCCVRSSIQNKDSWQQQLWTLQLVFTVIVRLLVQ